MNSLKIAAGTKEWLWLLLGTNARPPAPPPPLLVPISWHLAVLCEKAGRYLMPTCRASSPSPSESPMVEQGLGGEPGKGRGGEGEKAI